MRTLRSLYRVDAKENDMLRIVVTKCDHDSFDVESALARAHLSSFPSRAFDLAQPGAAFAAAARGQEYLTVMITHLRGKTDHEHF